ncbi:hydrolase, partial [Oryctes borbonicus]
TLSTQDTSSSKSKYAPNYNELTLDYNAVNFSLSDYKEGDVIFHLFTKQNDTGIYLKDNILDDTINRTIPTKFVIHGWFENETVEWLNITKDQYLQKGDYNVILVDWSRPASQELSVSAANTKPVGYAVAELITSFNFSLDKVHLIGHSFGAHIAGFAGKKVYNDTGSRIKRITANDPAREEFEHHEVDVDSRLSKYDADIVDVAHTDIGHYGFIKPIGTVDFYFNGGKIQPGCPPLIFDDNCHHVKSNYYFAKSINNNHFVAVKCTVSTYPFSSLIFPSIRTTFGEDMPESTINGVYCLATNHPILQGNGELFLYTVI